MPMWVWAGVCVPMCECVCPCAGVSVCPCASVSVCPCAGVCAHVRGCVRARVRGVCPCVGWCVLVCRVCVPVCMGVCLRVCVCGPLWGCVWAYVSRECVCSRGGGACVSLYVCAHVSACVPVPVCRCVCPGSFPGTSTHHQQPQRSCPTASDPPTGTKPPTFSGTQAPRREGSAHLLLQLLLVALPGQLVLILGPLGEKRAARTHLSRELHSGPTRPGIGTPTRHQPRTNMGGRGPPVRLSTEGLCRS